MEENVIKKRFQVPSEETWNLSDLFQDFDNWEAHFSQLPTENEIKEILTKKFQGFLHTTPEVLYECLQLKHNIQRKLENLYVYAHLRSTEDVTQSVATEAVGKIENKMSNLLSLFAFVDPEILTIPHLDVWKNKAPLNIYAFSLEELIRHKPHILSQQEEKILAKISVPLKIFTDIHSKWENADLKFKPAKDSQNKEHLVTNSRYSLNLQSQDRVLRENTFFSYYTEIAKWRNTITANYYGNMLAGSAMAKMRNFSGYLDAELFPDRIPRDLYVGLIQSVKKNLPLLHKSMELRKKILNIPVVNPYDRSVSLYQSQSKNRFSWEEGKELVLNAVAPLGKEYVHIAKRGLTEERWIDRAENEGKRSGAFSWGTYDSRPYLLQTWNGTLNDVYTLAHELGHSLHTYYSNKSQPYHLAHYPIFVAEVASTLNEALLSHFLLTHMKNTDLAKEVLSENLKNFEGTVLRQTLFAAFEQKASEIVDGDETLTPERLEDIYLGLNKQWYGPACGMLDAIKHEWMRIPHFYSAFYVYKYATSYCASLALMENFLAQPDLAQKQVLRLLQAGGSQPPLDILKEAGIDFLSPKPVEDAFLNYKKNIALAEKVLG